MSVLQNLSAGARAYARQVGKFNRNVRLLLAASMLTYLAGGIFAVDFNLYILSLGIEPDRLGRILSAGPVAHILMAIPIAFLAELIGFRKAFLLIYSLTGLAMLAQVATGNVYIITGAAFLQGLAISGDFVVRLPFFNANISGSERTYVFSMDAFLGGLSYALGALVAGFLPNLFRSLAFDLTVSYRFTLLVSGAIMILAVLPIFLIRDHTHLEKRKISLSPYLWGIDRFTVKAATVELFIGLAYGLVMPFMNIVFLYHLNTTREFYSGVEAFAFIPTMLISLLGPVLAVRLGIIRAVTLARLAMPVFLILLAVTTLPVVGGGSYWAYKALFSVGQSMWFAFVMEKATRKAKVAMSSWLEITFQIGMAVAAPLTGLLLVRSNYDLPFFLAAGAALMTAILTWVFMRGYHSSPAEEPLPAQEAPFS